MKGPIAAPLECLIVLGLALAWSLGGVRGDPSITRGGQGDLDVAWNFQNPTNYSLNGTQVQSGQAHLRLAQGWWNMTSQGDFSNYSSATNINLTARPGDVLLGDPWANRTATYVSVALGSGTAVVWRSLGWSNSSVTTNLSDEFVGSSLDPKWSWFNAPASSSVGSPRPGYLTFSPPGNTNFNNLQSSGPFLYQNLTGDFDLQMHLETTITTTNQKAGLLVMAGPDDWSALYRRMNAAGIVTRGVTTIAGVSTINGTLNLSPDYLRVRRVGNALETFYGFDGANWTFFLNIGSGTLPASLWVGAMASDSNAPSTLVVDVDYLRFSFPSAGVQVRTRVGNSTNSSDPSWTPWSQPHTNPQGSPLNISGSYSQFMLVLSTPSPYVRPFVSQVLMATESRGPRGTVTTEAFNPGGVFLWSLLALDVDLQGGSVATSYSLDGGVGWTAAQPGPLDVTVAGSLRIRLELATPDPSRDPSVKQVRVVLGVPGTTPGGALGSLPWWLLILPAALVPFVLLRISRRKPFKPTDIFLIHTDGRLILRIGGKDSPMTDDVAVSGMFTIMARFVRDSFGGASGAVGELKSLQVDQREVAIAKGKFLFLALVAEGRKPPGLEGTMVAFLTSLEAKYDALLRSWDGLDDDLGDLQGQLEGFLAKGYRKRSGRPSTGPQEG